MVIVVTGGGRTPPTLTSQANFTLMMECTLESGRYHSVHSVGRTIDQKVNKMRGERRGRGGEIALIRIGKKSKRSDLSAPAHREFKILLPGMVIHFHPGVSMKFPP